MGNMEYVRKTYDVPAKVGGRVEYLYVEPPLEGTIVGATNSGRLRIRIDGKPKAWTFHPTWMLRYW